MALRGCASSHARRAESAGAASDPVEVAGEGEGGRGASGVGLGGGAVAGADVEGLPAERKGSATAGDLAGLSPRRVARVLGLSVIQRLRLEAKFDLGEARSSFDRALCRCYYPVTL